MSEIYEWSWSEEEGNRFLCTTFVGTLALPDWYRMYDEALAEFDGGHLAILSDSRLSENTLSHGELLSIFDHLHSLGVRSIVCSLVVSDRLFHLKERLFNEVATMHAIDYHLKSFDDPDEARRWLIAHGGRETNTETP
jgi:hypothetical protein